jgi:hypothetical protein
MPCPVYFLENTLGKKLDKALKAVKTKQGR